MSTLLDLWRRLEMAGGHTCPICCHRTRLRLDHYPRSCDASKAVMAEPCEFWECGVRRGSQLMPDQGCQALGLAWALHSRQCLHWSPAADQKVNLRARQISPFVLLSCQGACFSGGNDTAALCRQLCWRAATQPAPHELPAVIGVRLGRPWHPPCRCQVPTLGWWYATYGHHRTLGARGAGLNLTVASSRAEFDSAARDLQAIYAMPPWLMLMEAPPRRAQFL